MPSHPKSVTEAAVSALKTAFVVTVVAAASVSFVATTLPYFVHIWKSVSTGVVPRYLFLVINSIIIVVWKLRGAAQRHDDDNNGLSEDFMPYRTSSSGSQNFPSRLVVDVEEDVASSVPTDDSEQRRDHVDDLPESDSDDKPPPEDAPEEHDDSMDAMWKAITGGRPFPNANKSLTKSDTWEKTTEASVVASPTLARSSAAVGRRFGKSDTFRERAEPDRPKKEMRKSETFIESSSYPSSPARSMGWRGRDRLVIGRDELFGKVEAFIKKNYEQMRLQRHERQESIRMVADTAY